MTHNNYKILVLSDLKSTSKTTINSAVSLAKMIGGTVNLFHVKTPSEVVKRDNQLSAIRSINEEHYQIRNKMQEYILPISDAYEIPISFNFAIGNVKNEIENYINETQPDIVVLGKSRTKRFKLMGEGIAHFILNNYDGMIYIVSEKNPIEPNKKMVLGMLSNNEDSLNIAFAEDLMANIDKPIKSFKIRKKTDVSTKNIDTNKKTVEYLFEHGDNVFKNLSKYLTINNINLLWITRENNTNSIDLNMKETIDGLNVSLLIGKKMTKINNTKKNKSYYESTY